MANLVRGHGTFTRPFPQRADLLRLRHGQGLGSRQFRQENLRGELLLCGEGRVQAGNDGLLDFGPTESFAGPRQFNDIERGRIAAPFSKVECKERGAGVAGDFSGEWGLFDKVQALGYRLDFEF